MLIDTHCHIHEADYPLDADEVIERAKQAGVGQIICVGTNLKTSGEAVEFVKNRENVFASVGIHPHFADKNSDKAGELIESLYFRKPLQPEFDKAPGPLEDPERSRFLNKRDQSAKDNRKIVAIGEIGLDYFYDNSPRDDQIKLLESQIELALKYDLPIIFHVRDAFDDFWPVFDKYNSTERPIRGVLHCFTDTWENAQKGIDRGLYFGVNGISTFTKDEAQQQMFANLPIDKILMETDAPALTPAPLRGKIKVNEPAYIREIAEFGSKVHKLSLDEFAKVTTENAVALFKL